MTKLYDGENYYIREDDDVMVCKAHPRYQGKRMPTSGCVTCLVKYFETQHLGYVLNDYDFVRLDKWLTAHNGNKS